MNRPRGWPRKVFSPTAIGLVATGGLSPLMDVLSVAALLRGLMAIPAAAMNHGRGVNRKGLAARQQAGQPNALHASSHVAPQQPLRPAPIEVRTSNSSGKKVRSSACLWNPSPDG